MSDESCQMFKGFKITPNYTHQQKRLHKKRIQRVGFVLGSSVYQTDAPEGMAIGFDIQNFNI